MAGGVLLVPVYRFGRDGDWLLSAFWLGASVAFFTYGLLSLVSLWERVPVAVSDMLRPLVKLGAIGIAVAGAAWFVVALNTLHQTDHFEGYPFLFGVLMATQGALMHWVQEHVPVGHAPESSA